jgi:tetratricopeptide (TPR) repeat protein
MLPIGDHPNFRACWIPGTVEQQQIDKLQLEARRVLTRVRARHRIKQVGALGLLVVTVGILNIGLTSRTLVAPASWLKSAETRWAEARTLLGSEVQQGPFLYALSHEDWVQQTLVPAAKAHLSPDIAFATARSAMWRGGIQNRMTAYADLKAAAGRSSQDVEILGAFVEVGASLGETLPEAFANASRAFGRMEDFNTPSLALVRAGAAMDIAEGNELRAAQRTKDCAGVDAPDAGCVLFHGLATQDTDLLNTLAERFPESLRVRLALSRVLLQRQRYAELETQLGILKTQLSEEGEVHALRADLLGLTGKWGRARKSAILAISMDPWRIGSLHLAAAVSLRIDRDPVAALALFDALMSQPNFQRDLHRVDILAQGADAALQTQDLRRAHRWVDEALRTNKHHVGAQLIKAQIYVAEGNNSGAKAVLRAIEYSADAPRQRALDHTLAGRSFLDLGFQRSGRAELESGIVADPLIIAPRRELAWAQLQTGDLPGVVSTIHQMVWLNPRRKAKVDPRTVSGPSPPIPRFFYRELKRALASDVRMEPEKGPTLALMAWVDGRPEAVQALRQALGWEEGRLELHGALAQSLLEAGDWQGALRQAKHVVQVRPSAGLYHGVLGRALSKSAAHQASNQAFELALKHAGTDPTVLWWAVEGRLAQGDSVGAKVLLARLAKLGVDEPAVQQTLLALSNQAE